MKYLDNLEDMKLVFSAGRDTDIANEYWAYKKADMHGDEFSVLRNEIKDRAGGLGIDNWVRKYKMSKSDEKDLNFYRRLSARGVHSSDDVMNSKLSSLKGFVNEIYGNRLWEGSVSYKNKAGEVKTKGYTKSIQHINPEIFVNFCRHRFENGYSVSERLSK